MVYKMMENNRQSTFPNGNFNLQASDVEACRICLATDVKLYSLLDTHLGSCLETIGGFPNTCEGLPNYVCYECAPTLIKCNELIEKSQKARATLLDIFENNGQVTKPLIKRQDKSQQNFNSDVNNKSEFIQAELYPNITIETKKDNEEGGVETKMDDEFIETVKESLSLAETNEQNSESQKVDDSLNQEDNPKVELSDYEAKQNVARCSPNREEIEKRKKRMFVQEIFNQLKPSKKQKRPSKRQLFEMNNSSSSSFLPKSEPMSQLEYHELKQYFKIVGKKMEIQPTVIDRKQKQTGIEFTCNVCFKSFGNADLLLEHSHHHMSSIHGNIECPVCLFCFSTDEEMKIHKKRVHACEYRCKFCPAVFDDLDDARTHKRSRCHDTVYFPCTNGEKRGSSVRSISMHSTSSSPEPPNQRHWYPKYCSNA